MKDTNIEIGSIWTRADIKYEIVGIEDQREDNEVLVWYTRYGTCWGNKEVATMFTFLKDFTPYKPVYKYQYTHKITPNSKVFAATCKHFTDEEAADLIAAYPELCYTKIEASRIEV